MNHNLDHFSQNIQSQSFWIVFGVSAIPWLMILIYILNIKFSKRTLIIYSLTMVILTYIICLLCGMYYLPKEDVYKYVSLIIYVTSMFILTSQGLIFCFHKAWISNDELFTSIYNPVDASNIILYSQYSSRIRIIRFISRYSMLSTVLFIILVGLVDAAEISLLYELPSYLVTCSAIMAAVFVVSIGILRVFATCDNCNLDTYAFDNELTAYFDVAKYAVKDKIIKCMHCKATLVLNPRMDLDVAKI